MHVCVSASVSCMSMWPAPQAYAADVFGSPCSKEWKEGPGALGTLKLRPSPTSSRPAPHGDFWGADEDAPKPESSGPAADG